MKRLSATFFALLLAALQVFAQTSIKVNVQNIVAADEQFSVTFVIEGEHKPSDFQWSPGEDFQLVWGPQKGSSSSTSIINGKISKSSQTTYTYILMPRAAGSFKLAAATATVKGETISSRTVSIQVVANGSSPAADRNEAEDNAGASQGGGGSTAGRDTPGGEDIFLRLILSKRSAIVGETVSATLKLYQRVNIAGFEDARFPQFNGFWSQETQSPSNIEFHRETIGDKIYNAAVLRAWNLVPQQAGEITIEPAELVCLVNVRTRRNSTGSIFDSFFQDDYQTIRKRVSTAPVKVQVSKVPAGAPASFGGGVGSFKMSAALTRDSLRTHDAASLRITISGSGNLQLLEAPKLNFPPDFEVYDIKTSEASGSRTFEYPFIPRSPGDFEIGPVEYSYYDVKAGRYVTLTSGPLPLKVSRGNESAPAAGEGGGTLVQAPARKDVRDLGSDIRFISTRMPRLRGTGAGAFFAGSPAWWALMLSLLPVAAVIYLAVRKRAASKADVAGSRRRAAAKMARRRLSQASEFLKKDLYTAFYEELHKTLLDFAGNKLGLPAAGLSKDNICSALTEAGVSEADAERFTGLIDACEFARYAPSAGHEAMNEHFEGAVEVISSIESSMKKKSSKAPGAGTAALLALLLTLSLQAATSSTARAEDMKDADIQASGAPVAEAADMQAADLHISDAQTPDTQALWSEGTQAYTEGRWSDAAAAWKAIEAGGMVSGSLLCNIGDAFFKDGDIARAVLYYRRALKFDPSFEDARYNLEFARTQVQDRIETLPEFFLSVWMRKLCYLLPSDAWAWASVALLALSLAMLLLFLLGKGSAARRAGFFSAIAGLLLMVFCICFAFRQKAEALDTGSAVVTAPVTEVKSSPGSGVSLFVLHSGTELRLIEEVGGWYNAELSDGRRGWISKDSIELI
ncbi:MAG: BatD family protein [Bacteroidales bacterium]|nr:BatD family protein [Bacteroidales bacterium]